MLEIDWDQSRPTWNDVSKHSRIVPLTNATVGTGAIDEFLTTIRNSHSNGGAILISTTIAPDSVLDWFLSRNRLTDEDLLVHLLNRSEIRQQAPEVFNGVRDHEYSFEMVDSFNLVGHIASKIHFGGAYSEASGDGSGALESAIAVCEQMFQRRFDEITYFVSWKPWSRWFNDVAWDYSGVVFDRRQRTLWLLFITDTD